MITDLTQDEARKLLSEQKVGRLGCILGDGEPYVVPVNYFYKDNCIYIHSKFGLKIEALRANPKACLQTDDAKNHFNWRSVIAFGEFEEITEKKERELIFVEMFTLFQELTPVESLKDGTNKTEETVLFRIRLRHITGRTEN